MTCINATLMCDLFRPGLYVHRYFHKLIFLMDLAKYTASLQMHKTVLHGGKHSAPNPWRKHRGTFRGGVQCFLTSWYIRFLKLFTLEGVLKDSRFA